MKKEIWTYLETDGRGELVSSSVELLAKAKIIAAAAEEEEKKLKALEKAEAKAQKAAKKAAKK